MAGNGPPPKPSDQRARRNKDVIPLKLVHREPEQQPELPPGVEWHMQTVLWWLIWGQDPLSDEFGALEWAYLAETALLVNAFWKGDFRVASELRLRAAKFGVTPEDRARLRIQVVTAQNVEDERAAKGSLPSSRSRYQNPGQAS